jgi:hypothetical protein
VRFGRRSLQRAAAGWRGDLGDSVCGLWRGANRRSTVIV